MTRSIPWKTHLIICVLLAVFTSSKADPIHEAAESGDVDQIMKLLDGGADVNAPDLDGTPLQWALLANQIDVARLLLKHGANPNVKGWDGTLLESAALNGNTPIVKVLLEHGANPNSGDRSTPLIRAVQKGSLEIVALLITQGADPSLATPDGTTPLHEAARGGKLEIAQRLVDRGADVNALDGLGRPPIHFAVAKNHLDLATYLKKHGAIPGKTVSITGLLASADAVQGKLIAEKQLCIDCHIVDKAGPPLWGVVGRIKGSANDYSYSPSLGNLKGKWTFEALNEFLARPTEVVPGTRMIFRGISDPKMRADVIVYLRSLSNDPVPLP